MKLNRKVSCAQCSHYRGCPQKTRMYINYCGSEMKANARQIKAAIDDCHARKGHCLKRHVITYKTKSVQLHAA